MSYTFPFTGSVIELGGGDNPYFRPNLDVRSGPTVDIVADFNKNVIDMKKVIAANVY